MASPQKENGYTALANEILDKLMQTKLTDYEHRVLWAIIRRTYGYHKIKDRISVTLLEKMTGIYRRAIWRTLKSLNNKNIIYKDHRYKNINIWGFQKDYDKWGVTLETPVTGDTKGVTLETLKVVTVQPPIKDIYKETYKETTSGKKPDGKKRVCKRRKSQFSKDWYIICLQEYQRLKGIKLQGEEFKPLQQTLKTIFMSGRTPADIIKCMKFMADDDFYKTVWTLKTVKLKLPEFLAEKLNPDKQYSQDELREQYNKTLRR